MAHKRERKFFSVLRTKNLSIAKKALRKVNKLARRVKPEPKFHDIGLTTLAPTIAGLITHLTAIAQGETETTRNGIQVRVFFMEFRWILVKDSVPATSTTRILIVRDNRQVESTSPTVIKILQAANPISPYTRINPKRFTVLYNKTITLDSTRISRRGQITRKLSFPLQYIGAASTSITKNGMYLLTESDNAATEEPSFRFTIRIRYSDV